MNNLDIYEKVRSVPDGAKKKIQGGSINGFTDINPMWRIKTLTELFGPCGTGWYTEIIKQWVDTGPDGKIAAFCNINLYINIDGEWSKPIVGTGGSMLADIAKGELKSSDECFKMAYTDALSVSCKLLGIGADVYWEKDTTKYTEKEPLSAPKPEYICSECGNEITGIKTKKGESMNPEQISERTKTTYGKQLCYACSVSAANANK